MKSGNSSFLPEHFLRGSYSEIVNSQLADFSETLTHLQRSLFNLKTFQPKSQQTVDNNQSQTFSLKVFMINQLHFQCLYR